YARFVWVVNGVWAAVPIARREPTLAPATISDRPSNTPRTWSVHPVQEPFPTMISTGELRKGVVIELDGDLWQILDYHHIKMGRGSAQVRIKLRNVKKGSTVEKSFQAGERWPRAQIDRRPVQFLYRDGDDLHFMETDSYEQFSLR